MDIKQLYIENCEGYDEYLPDGSCRKGLRMTIDGFKNALTKVSQFEPLVMQLLAGKGINAVELRHLVNKVKKVKIKDNLKEILTTTFPDEYNDSDFIFFERYAGKEANIYQWAGDWWILEDDNYLITPDCFEELSKQSV